MESFDEQREQMVVSQVAARGIRSQRLLDAMRRVPRERFVPAKHRSHAYDDGPLPIGEGQTISQPYIVAVMIDAVDLQPSDRVLEVGAGCGYAASVMGLLSDEVHAIERHAELTQSASRLVQELGYVNVHIHHGDGTLGWPARAPFDAIVVSAGGTKIPGSLQGQLAVGGRLVIPVEEGVDGQRLRLVRRVEVDRYESSDLGRVSFVPLIGREA